MVTASPIADITARKIMPVPIPYASQTKEKANMPKSAPTLLMVVPKPCAVDLISVAYSSWDRWSW